MQGDINSKMTQGIDDSAVIVVFITNQYIRKVAGDGAAGADDNCKMEFDYAVCIGLDLNPEFLDCVRCLIWYGSLASNLRPTATAQGREKNRGRRDGARFA
jgi:hypothetical protein